MPATSLRTATLGLTALALSACTAMEPEPQPAPPPSSASADDPCGAQQFKDYIGKVAAGPVETRIREQVGDQRVRVYGPDDAVTMDYRSDRLNVETDAAGKIVKVRCG